MIVIPFRFNKNAPDVYCGATASASGTSLLAYMCRRLAVPDLSRHDVLDFGCGCRFAEAIVNAEIPVKSYTGIDLDKEMIDYLAAHIDDPRLSFHHFDARNPFYNPDGEPMSPDRALPVGDRKFDSICMFSVITHQLPDDAAAIFAMLRRHIKDDGHMFFSASVEEGDVDYAERLPERPAGLSSYSDRLLRRLVAEAGWEIVSAVGKNPEDLPILDSFVCRPREAAPKTQDAPPLPETASRQPPPPSDEAVAELSSLRDQLHEARAAAAAHEAGVKALTDTLREADAALLAAQAELASLRSKMPAAAIAYRSRGFTLPEEARMTAGKRLLAIVGAQRSGTTVIGRLVGAQPGVRYVGEIFHMIRGPHDDIDFKRFQHVPEVNFFSYREALFARFPGLCYPSYQNQRAVWHSYVEFLFAFSPAQIWLIDIKYNSLHHLDSIWRDALDRPLIIDILGESGVPILHVTRRDLFAQAVSEARSHIVGRWHSSEGAAHGAASATPIPLDPAELERIMARNQHMTEHMREILRFYPRADELEYDEALGGEDLSPAARARIAELFELGPPLAGALDLRKMTPKKLDEMVPNGRAVRAYFAGTRFEEAVAKHLSGS